MQLIFNHNSINNNNNCYSNTSSKSKFILVKIHTFDHVLSSVNVVNVNAKLTPSRFHVNVVKCLSCLLCVPILKATAILTLSTPLPSNVFNLVSYINETHRICKKLQHTYTAVVKNPKNTSCLHYKRILAFL